eukprot:TRINITY_DN233_c0_g1_i3.p1 TRINITY_DN233_c0_g1~~TRINITY_DN233_c0_g1_i3.p1  ORF type:complete len:424 (-),score=37.34 TRINITY_DN233_c0_g1_i3:212-1483(-)
MQLPIIKPNRSIIPYRPILAIDGGGVRGVIPLTVLAALELKIKETMINNQSLLVHKGILSTEHLHYLEKGIDGFEVQLADFFDLVCGVSVGSIIASYLATKGAGTTLKLQMDSSNKVQYTPGTAKTGLKLFTVTANEAFKKNGWFSGWVGSKFGSEGLDSLTKALNGEDTLLSEVDGTSFLASTYELDGSRATLFFRDTVAQDKGKITILEQPNILFEDARQMNVGVPKLAVQQDLDYRLWEIVRSSCAAPTYFPAHKIRSTDDSYSATHVDGGVVANNIDYLGINYYCTRHDINVRNVAILSLGTGTQDKNLAQGRSLDRGSIRWINDLIHILLSGGDEVNELNIGVLIYYLLGASKPQYLRIQGRRGYEKDGAELPDLADVEQIPQFEKIGLELVQTFNNSLQEFIDRFLLGVTEHPPPSK